MANNIINTGMCDDTGPYIFVSYAHKDSDMVTSVIRTLYESGYRVWFDGGLEPGTEWQNGIGDHIEHCTVFLCFVSESSIRSDNCKNEIAMANSNRLGKIRHCLYIYTDESLENSIESGTRMNMIRHQKMFLNRHPSWEVFYRELLAAPILMPCKKGCQNEKERIFIPKTPTNPAPGETVASGEAPASGSSKLGFLWTILFIALCAYLVLGSVTVRDSDRLVAVSSYNCVLKKSSGMTVTDVTGDTEVLSALAQKYDTAPNYVAYRVETEGAGAASDFLVKLFNPKYSVDLPDGFNESGAKVFCIEDDGTLKKKTKCDFNKKDGILKFRDNSLSRTYIIVEKAK